jgi:hypothetical protein
MFRMATTRLDSLQDRQGRNFSDVMSDSEQPFDTVHGFSICGGRQHLIQDSVTHERIPLVEGEAQPTIDHLFSSEHPQGTKQSRQAVDVSAHLSLQRQGWKHTGKKSSLGAFEHRWPHRRDHAECRNHRLPSNIGEPT